MLALGYYFTVDNQSEVCDEVGSLMRPQDMWPPDEGDLRGIEFSFDVESGETARLRLTQRNVSDKTISYTAGHGSPNFFIVAASSCDEVWVWQKIVLLATSDGELAPHEERVWAVEWARVNQLGEPVDPVEYLAYATYGFLVDGGSSPTFLSSPRRLEVE